MAVTNNSPAGETAMASTSDVLTNPNDIYSGDLDLGDEQDNDEVIAQGSETNSETAEEPVEETGQESEEPTQEETTDETVEQEAPAITDEATVDYNGEKLTIAELKAGYMRQADQTRKGQENANYRRELTETAQRVQRFSDALVGILAEGEPQMPNPQTVTDPTQFAREFAMYQIQKQNYDAVVGRITEAVSETKQVEQKLSQDELANLMSQRDSALREKLPTAKTDVGLKQVIANATKVAEVVGFPKELISSTTDPRIWMALDLAYEGYMKRNAAVTAKAKAQPAPQPAVKKAKVHPNSMRALEMANAEKRFLSKPTSANAALTDFDQYS